MEVGGETSLHQRTRQVLVKGRQVLDPVRPSSSPIRRDPLDQQPDIFLPLSSSLMEEIATVRGNFNQLLGVANPSTAATLGGEVVGGVPLIGGFYPTPTPISHIPPSADPAGPRTTPEARPTAASSSMQPSSRPPTPSPTLLGAPNTQLPRTTGSPLVISPAVPPIINSNSPTTSLGTFPATIPPTVDSEPRQSSVNMTDNPDRFQLPTGVIIGIAVGALLLVLTILLGCWHLNSRRRAARAKRMAQRESFLHNPILSTLMVPNQSSAGSYRGTPYLGGQGDLYYGGPASVARDTRSSFGLAFPQPQHQMASFVEDDSRLNEVNYLNVSGDLPRIDSLRRPMQENGGESYMDKGARISNTYTQTTTQYLHPDAESETSEESESLRSRRTSYASELSIGSLMFPEVAKFRSVPKNEAGIPIQNLAANRVKSQMASNILEYEEQEGQYDEQESDHSSNHDSLNVDPNFPSFYLPRAGDPKKISVPRGERQPTQSLGSRITNFSYPMPRVVASPPPVPGPILNRPRYKYGQQAGRNEATESPPSPPAEPAETAGPSVTRPGSTATPGFANNRYIPTKGKKRITNANVLSVLHKSSLRKSSAKSMLPKRQSLRPKRQSLLPMRQSLLRLSTARLSTLLLTTDNNRLSLPRRPDRHHIPSVSSIDVPDPYVVVK